MRIIRSFFNSLIFICVFSYLTLQESEAQQVFSTPEEAVSALFNAVDTEDMKALSVLFSSEFTKEVSSGDAQADLIGVRRLAMLMRQSYKLLPMGRYNIVEIGSDKFRFPLQIALTTKGKWAFNVEAGKKTLLRRRIEKNEERVLKIVNYYATAQEKYRALTGAYAQKFHSTPGRKDGLYWKTGTDGLASPIEPLVTRIENLGYENKGRETPVLSGYIFRVLTSQGEYAPGKSQSYLDSEGRLTKGFALIAYPSRYGISGKMSFIVAKEGTIYERDFGEDTDSRVYKIARYDPDPSWHMIGGKIPVVPTTVRVINTAEIYPFYTEDY